MELLKDIKSQTYLDMAYETIDGLMHSLPHWGYSGATNIRSLLYYKYNLNKNLEDVLVMKHFTQDVVTQHKAVDILHTKYLNDKTLDLYVDGLTIYGIKDNDGVWIVQPSKQVLEQIDNGTRDPDAFIDDILHIITEIHNMNKKDDDDNSNLPVTKLIHKYIESL